MFFRAFGLVAAATTVLAINAPHYDGFNLILQEPFTGAAGSSPSSSFWEMTEALSLTGYTASSTSSNANVQISGGGSVQLVPRRGVDGIWTSGQMVSIGRITPYVGKITRLEGSLRMGVNPASAKQGISAGFQVSGNASTTWPQNGVMVIFTQRNGAPDGSTNIYCGTAAKAGICNDNGGQSATFRMPDDINTKFHTFSLTWDRTDSNWENQKITWALDGKAYHTLTGAQVGFESTWAVLAHSGYKFSFYVDVGGIAGPAIDTTADGYGAMLEMQYIAIYSNK